MQGAVHRWTGSADELLRALVMLSFLPHQAWISVNAIVRCLLQAPRKPSRNLLEWTTAETARTPRHSGMATSLSGQLNVVAALPRRRSPSSFYSSANFSPHSLFLRDPLGDLSAP